MTHYATLGVDPTATDLEILDAYSELSDWLTSAEGHDPVMYELVQEAFDALSIPERRAAYDRALMEEREAANQHVSVEHADSEELEGPRLGVGALVQAIGWMGIAGLTAAAAIAGYVTFLITGSGDGASLVFFIGCAVLIFLLLRIYWRVTNNS